MSQPLSTVIDSRLTDFSWAARRAAPVARLIDPHTHYSEKPGDFETLLEVLDRHNVECINLIFWNNQAAGLRRAQELAEPGERFIPYYRLSLDSADPAQVKTPHYPMQSNFLSYAATRNFWSCGCLPLLDKVICHDLPEPATGVSSPCRSWTGSSNPGSAAG